MKRTSIVRLVPDEDAEAKLKALCSLASKLWNEVNYARRRQFFEKKGVNLRVTYREFYEKYKKLVGSATTQQVLNKNNEAWRSFFSLLKARKEGKLPPFMRRINPPDYKKKRGRRVLWVVLRNDQYKINSDTVEIKGLGAIGRINVKYRGLIHLRGKQRRMEIRYDADAKKWYAHITFEVEEKAVRKVWYKVPRDPRGDLRAGVDIGINNLFAVYVEDGKAMLVNGRPLKSISHYWRKKISKYQSMLNRYGLKTSRKLRLMYAKWRRQVRNFINCRVRELIEWLYNNGVSLIYVGYPKMISQNNGDFNNVQVWNYGYLLKRLVEVAEEYGIEVMFVNESFTSKACPIHGNGCGRRVKRGLFKCSKLNMVFNADLVGAYNILVKGLSITPNPHFGDRGNGAETRPWAESPLLRGNVALNLPALAGTPTL